MVQAVEAESPKALPISENVFPFCLSFITCFESSSSNGPSFLAHCAALVSSQAFPSETPQASLKREALKLGLVLFSSVTNPFVRSRRARMVMVVPLIVSAISWKCCFVSRIF